MDKVPEAFLHNDPEERLLERATPIRSTASHTINSLLDLDAKTRNQTARLAREGLPLINEKLRDKNAYKEGDVLTWFDFGYGNSNEDISFMALKLFTFTMKNGRWERETAVLGYDRGDSPVQMIADADPSNKNIRLPHGGIRLDVTRPREDSEDRDAESRTIYMFDQEWGLKKYIQVGDRDKETKARLEARGVELKKIDKWGFLNYESTVTDQEVDLVEARVNEINRQVNSLISQASAT
ncbi:MAG TPA: hypothetical protein VJC10_01535 [Patescibacteria group bacterium]|nr:hypothetical protein [Patescibacteria group bacterium]